jgi:hypothetical protein
MRWQFAISLPGQGESHGQPLLNVSGDNTDLDLGSLIGMRSGKPRQRRLGGFLQAARVIALRHRSGN